MTMPAKYPALRLVILVVAITISLGYLPIFLPPIIQLAIAAGCVGMILFAIRFRQYVSRITVMVVLAIGLIRQADESLSPDHISHFTDLGRDVQMDGVISGDLQKINGKRRFLFAAHRINVSRHLGYETQGLIYVYTEDSTLSYGDEVRIFGSYRQMRSKRNPGEFDYAQYMAWHGIYGTLHAHNVSSNGKNVGNPLTKYFFLPIKHFVGTLNQKTLSPVSAAIATGLTVGERSDIPQEVIQAFSLSGTIHILSISGLHVAFVAALLMGIFALFRIPYRARVIATIVSLFLYAGIAEFVPPVLRSAVMASVVLAGTLFERKTNVINSLLVSLLILLWLDPNSLFDIGFQLSFMAVLSMVLIYPKLENWARQLGLYEDGQTWREKILALTMVSIAAQIGSIPLTSYYFYKIPMTAVLANVLIVPLSNGVMGLGFLTGFAGIVSESWASWYAGLNEGLIQGMVWIAQFSITWPFAYMDFYLMNRLTMFIFYGVLVMVLFWNHTKIRKWGLLLGLMAFGAALWIKNFEEPKLRVTFLDVAQGDAAVIQLPSGKTIVVDAGDRDEAWDFGERSVAPFLWKEGIAEIEALIVSHPHDDHIGGVPFLLKNFTVKNVLKNAVSYDSDSYRELVSLCSEKGIRVTTLSAFEKFKIEEATFFCYNPAPAETSHDLHSYVNNTSVVVQLQYGVTKYLFTGDAEVEAIQKTLRFGNLLKSDVIKVDHHGSINGTTPEWASKIQPKYAVISCGQFNKFNHPSREVVRMWEAVDAKVLRTDREGAIILESDGLTVERRRF